MISSFRSYSIRSDQPLDWQQIELGMQEARFRPCEPSEQQSLGWAPVVDGDEKLIESAGDFKLAYLAIETKSVPAQAIEAAVEERANQVVSQSGRTPGRKERKELREQVLLELLPRAFPKRTRIAVLVDTSRSRIYVGSATSSMADTVAIRLVGAGLTLEPLQTAKASASAMCSWILDSDALLTPLAIADTVALVRPDEQKATIRYKNYAADASDIVAHVKQGFGVKSLGLSLGDRASFSVNSELAISSVKLLEGVDLSAKESREPVHADMLIYGAQAREIVDALIDELGGVLEGDDEKHDE